jgi:hypothetical protein
MKFVKLFCFAGLVSVMATGVAADCDQHCKTTIEVKGCGDKPVKGVEVELTLRCQTKHVKLRTGEDGRAVFNFCWKDVSEKTVDGLVGRKVVGPEARSDKEVTVTIAICGDD